MALSLLAIVLAWLALRTDIREAATWIPGPLALTRQLLATLGEWACYCAIVALLIRAVHGRAGFLRGTRIFLAGIALNYLLPLKPGIPLRLYLYRRILQIPYAAGAAVLLLEMLLISGLPLLLAPLCLWYLGIPVTHGGSIVLGLFAAVALSVLLARRQRLTRRLRFAYRLRRYLERPFRRSPALMLTCMLLLPLAMLLYGLRLWFILAPFGAPVTLPVLCAVATVSVTAGRLSMLPMGLGALDLSLGLLLTRAGATPEAVLAAVALNRIWISAVPLLAGLAAAPGLWRPSAGSGKAERAGPARPG